MNFNLRRSGEESVTHKKLKVLYMIIIILWIEAFYVTGIKQYCIDISICLIEVLSINTIN